MKSISLMLAVYLLAACTSPDRGQDNVTTAGAVVSKLREDVGAASSLDLRRRRLVLFDGTFCTIWETREAEFESQPPTSIFRSFLNPEAEVEEGADVVFSLGKEMARDGLLTMRRDDDGVQYEVTIGDVRRHGGIDTTAAFERLPQCAFEPLGA